MPSNANERGEWKDGDPEVGKPDCAPARGSEKVSKMQAILDDAKLQWERGNSTGAIDRLIDAIKLLSKAQQQVMGDLNRVSMYRDDIPIK